MTTSYVGTLPPDLLLLTDRLDRDQDLDWSNVDILDHENFYHKSWSRKCFVLKHKRTDLIYKQTPKVSWSVIRGYSRQTDKQEFDLILYYIYISIYIYTVLYYIYIFFVS